MIKQSLFMALGLFLASILGLWLSIEDESRRQSAEPPEEYTEYFMDKFTLVDMGPEGEIKYRLEASKLFYFSTDVTQLYAPNMQMVDESGSDWRLQARNGTMYPDNSYFFGGDVQIVQQRPKLESMTIRTQDVNVNASHQIVSTSQSVELQYGNSAVEAEGMVYDVANQQMNLLENVRGHYFVNE